MSFLKGIIGAGIGAIFGGPIGAAIGFGLASSFDDPRSQRRRIKENISRKRRQGAYDQKDQTQLAYFTAIFSVLAKMSKADGRISKDEIKVVESFMTKTFKLNEDEKRFAIGVFTKAKDDHYSVEEYLSQFYSIVNQDSQMAISFLTALHMLAKADSILHDAEVEILYKAERIFNIRSGYVDDLIGKEHINLAKSYEILDANPSMNDRELKRQYLAKCKEYHPDKLEAKGLPKEFINMANEKMVEVQNAYEKIKENRKQSV